MHHTNASSPIPAPLLKGAVRRGMSDSEVEVATQCGIFTYDYVRIRSLGYPADETVGAVAALGSHASYYPALRELTDFPTHESVVKLARAAGDLQVYLVARKGGASHASSLQLSWRRPALSSPSSYRRPAMALALLEASGGVDASAVDVICSLAADNSAWTPEQLALVARSLADSVLR